MKLTEYVVYKTPQGGFGIQPVGIGSTLLCRNDNDFVKVNEYTLCAAFAKGYTLLTEIIDSDLYYRELAMSEEELRIMQNDDAIQSATENIFDIVKMAKATKTIDALVKEQVKCFSTSKDLKVGQQVHITDFNGTYRIKSIISDERVEITCNKWARLKSYGRRKTDGYFLPVTSIKVPKF